MDLLARSKTIKELKGNYRKLASQYHPDRGGDTFIMQKINTLYKSMLSQMKYQNYDDFTDIMVGMFVYINGTESEVLAVYQDTFRVVALGRTRQAQFYKDTGIGRFNTRLVARYHQTH